MDFIVSLFAENAWPLVWFIALVDLLLAIAIYATGRGRLLTVIIGLAALAPLLLILERLIVTDRERVDAVVDEMAEAVRAENADRLMSHISPQCRYANRGREAIAAAAANVFQLYEIERLTLNGRKTRVASARGEATAEFVAVARGRQGTLDVNIYPTRWQLTFQRDKSGSWQVVEIEQLPVVGDKSQGIIPPVLPGSR